MSNVFFDLTREFNADGVVAILASGQAVVFYRLALMSKDGDWVMRESEPACRHVRRVLAHRGAKYRLAPPLDPRWLAGGWSSHFEFLDEKRRRVRCDFVSRPPRVAVADVDRMFDEAHGEGGLRVVDPERLIRLKQTQRAKDYPVIGELSRRLAPEREIDRLQREDRERLGRYERAAQPYLTALRTAMEPEMPLEETHDLAVRLAERLLPTRPAEEAR